MSYNSDAMPDIFRLASLKNVHGRRKVRPDAPYLEQLEDFTTDISGTAPPVEKNIPQADLGGELTPQSYDVRANEIINPEEEDMSVFRRFGQALSDYFNPQKRDEISAQNAQIQDRIQNKGMAQTPPIETQQVQASEGLPTSSASEEESSVWSKLGNLAEPFKEYWNVDKTPERENLIENARLRSQGINPDEYRSEQEQIHKNTQEVVLNKIDKALENPTETAVYGATDIVANQPQIVKNFQTVTGIDLNGEIAKQTAEYEKVLDDLENNFNAKGEGYTEQENRIKERILSNQANDADKFFIGLALLMPLLAGAMFGKEAALGALGGGFKGISDVLGRREKNISEDEKLLADISSKRSENELKKAELGLKRLSLPGEIQKNLPSHPEEHLVGKRKVDWIDPETGEQKVGYEIKPDLIARPEFVKDKDELKEMRKEAVDISDAINPVKEINKLTGDIIEIAGKMKNKGFISDAISSYLSGKSPALATKLGEPVEFQGRKVNSYVVLEHKLKLLVDAYRQAKGMRALTSTVQEHIDSLFRNPAASFQSYEDTIDQMLYTRDLAQNRLLNNVESSGFVPTFVKEKLQPEVKEIYGKLNKREGEKESSKLLKG